MPGYRMQILKKLPSFLLVLTIFFGVTGILYAQEVTSPLIKSGLIHKFAQHIVWPEEEVIDTFRIGVFGEERELMSNIMLLESFDLKGKPISIKKFDQLNNISGIHLLYLTRDANSEIQKVSRQIAGSNTLMVSDRARNQNLIMINFLPMTEGKAEFEINKANIIEAGMEIAPDLLLLGGTEIDVVGLFKQSQQAMQRFKDQLTELSESYKSKSRQIEEQNKQIEEQYSEIEAQREEINTQKELYEEQAARYKLQQEEMDARAEQLAEVLNELEEKQQTLDSKIKLINDQEVEINIQRAEIENRTRILKQQEDQIKTQEKKIEVQVSQLSNFANTVARQRIFLYIIIAVCILIVFLVFFIYNGYRIKKNANLEIERKNRELEKRQEEILLQSEEILQANEEVIATNENLEIRTQELQYTLENLKLAQTQLIQSEKMASVGVLTAGIAHELNNPINFVSGNVKPLRRDIEDIFAIIEKYESIIKSSKLTDTFSDVDAFKDNIDYSLLMKEIIGLLEGIEEGANRSSTIVKGLRSFSRLDEEKLQIYDIHEGIDSTLILLYNKIKSRITIRKEYGDIKDIECYPSKLKQVLMNILTNSIQAIEEKGEIVIQTISSDSGVKIVIKDNGRGMSKEVKEHIFEPFYTTKDVGKGTGLGLSISFGIIEEHHGSIDVLSEPGKGSEFIISLPKKQSE